jgi:polysaccharide pyruvyl transferase CsaB
VKALLLGYYGLKNLGDEMMLFCLRRQLEERGFRLTVLSEQPQEVGKLHQLPAVQNCPLLGQWAWRFAWFKGGAARVIGAVAENDALVIGGGDLIRDDLGWRVFSYTMEKFILALLLGKKVYLLNVGLGPPRSRFGRFLLRWALRHCEEIVVRDPRSLAICREMSAPKARLAPDIVLSLPELIDEKPTPSPSPSNVDRPYVLVCLRADPNAFHFYDFNSDRVKKFAFILDALIEQHGVDVVFMPFQQLSGSDFDDNSMHRQVGREMQHQARIRILSWTDDFRQICDHFRNALGVICMRLHAAVLAVAYARPCILMPLDHKLQEFAALMNLPHLIDVATLDQSAFVHALIENALGKPTLTTLAPHSVMRSLKTCRDEDKLKLLGLTELHLK